MELQDNRKWEEAFVKFGFDAAVGRLFRGIIHNLNGVGQAFSMQAELLNMMFGQVDGMLAEISRATTLAEAQEKSAKLRVMLTRRAELAKHLTGEVKILLETMRRTAVLTEETGGSSGGKSLKLEAVIATEIEFLNSDGFFKHKIKKDLAQVGDISACAEHRVVIHQILGVLLENASQVLADNIAGEPAPEISITTANDGVNFEIVVADNGPGIDAIEREKIFAPFYTTKKDHLGLGLYLAQVMAVNSGGALTCESSSGRTCFTLKMPLGDGFED